MINIRLAEPTDADAIASVKTVVWPEESVNRQRIEDVITDRDHATHVAEIAGRIVGFVDGFVTRTHTGALRWEVDLLAVHPDLQRRGVAKRLILASGDSGCEKGATQKRGLIHVDNVGSMRAFGGCGYQPTDDGHCSLLVATANVAATQSCVVTGSHLVHVRTINYRGLWIEGTFSAANLGAAIWCLVQERLDLVGAVIPVKNEPAIRAALAAGCQHVGDYQYWTTSTKAL